MEANLRPWQRLWQSVELDLLPWKLMEAGLSPWKLVEASMETHGSFHCRWKIKVSMLTSVSASMNTFGGSFDEFPLSINS